MFGKILFISVFSIVRMTSAPWMADYFTIMELPSRSSSYEPVYSKCYIYVHCIIHMHCAYICMFYLYFINDFNLTSTSNILYSNLFIIIYVSYKMLIYII